MSFANKVIGYKPEVLFSTLFSDFSEINEISMNNKEVNNKALIEH